MQVQLNFEPGSFYWILAPILMSVLSFVALLWDAVFRPRDKNPLVWSILLGVVGVVVLTAVQWTAIGHQSLALFGGMIQADRFSMFFLLLLSLLTVLVILLSRDYLEREEIHIGEYYALLLFAVIGMMLLAMSSDLIMSFIAIEVMSVSIYVLAAFNRSDYRSIEGALKYFILGAFATGFLLYGIALLFGATGTTDLADIREFARSGRPGALYMFGSGLLILGMGFKIAAVPFHMWAPDVYEGSATPVTATMATGVKVGAFAALIRILASIMGTNLDIKNIIWVIAALTIVVGNIAALRQTNIKRMLAYSGIGHSGYLLAGTLALGGGSRIAQTGVSSLMFYLAAYILMNLGAFAVLIAFGKKEDEPLTLEQWSGLGLRYPLLGAAMTVFMLSLGGLPPTAGFFGKFFLFSSILDAGYTNLVILAVLASAASFYFYLRVVVYMYMYPGDGRRTANLTMMLSSVILITAVGSLFLGLLPSDIFSLVDFARKSVAGLP